MIGCGYLGIAGQGKTAWHLCYVRELTDTQWSGRFVCLGAGGRTIQLACSVPVQSHLRGLMVREEGEEGLVERERAANRLQGEPVLVRDSRKGH